MLGTPKKEVFIQPLVVGAFALRIASHKIIRMPQQPAVPRRGGLGRLGKHKRRKDGSLQYTHNGEQVRRTPDITSSSSRSTALAVLSLCLSRSSQMTEFEITILPLQNV